MLTPYIGIDPKGRVHATTDGGLNEFATALQNGGTSISSRTHPPGRRASCWLQLDGKHIGLTFRTRDLHRGFSDKVPGDLWVDAEGEADGLLEAAQNFGNVAREIAAVIA